MYGISHINFSSFWSQNHFFRPFFVSLCNFCQKLSLKFEKVPFLARSPKYFASQKVFAAMLLLSENLFKNLFWTIFYTFLSACGFSWKRYYKENLPINNPQNVVIKIVFTWLSQISYILGKRFWPTKYFGGVLKCHFFEFWA